MATARESAGFVGSKPSGKIISPSNAPPKQRKYPQIETRGREGQRNSPSVSWLTSRGVPVVGRPVLFLETTEVVRIGLSVVEE